MNINLIWQNIHHRWQFVFGMLLLAATIMVCSYPSGVWAEGASSATLSTTNAPCIGLKPFNDLDELLYQFYINLDSDCLFKMPVEELEKIWDTKILSEERPELQETDLPLRNETDFFNKPYKSKRDAFYVEIGTGADNKKSFHIYITREYQDTFYSLLPDGKPPKLLPKPSRYILPTGRSPLKRPEGNGSAGESLRIRPGPSFWGYYWANSDRTRFISFSLSHGVTGITIRNYTQSEAGQIFGYSGKK